MAANNVVEKDFRTPAELTNVRVLPHHFVSNTGPMALIIERTRSGLVQNLEGSKKAPRCGKRLEVDIQKLQLMPKFNINNLAMTKVGPAV